jgi:adenylate cyclase class IV
MGHKNREIEIKLRVEGAKSIDQVSAKFGQFLDLNNAKVRVIENKSSDIYFKSPENSKADFVRVRYNPNGLSEMTVKSQDKGNNFDRVEIDLKILSAEQGIALLTRLLGKPAGKITKRYRIYFLDHNDTNISIYQISGDKSVFIEIEARTKSKVLALAKVIQVLLPWPCTTVTESLYSLYIKNKKANKPRKSKGKSAKK